MFVVGSELVGSELVGQDLRGMSSLDRTIFGLGDHGVSAVGDYVKYVCIKRRTT